MALTHRVGDLFSYRGALAHCVGKDLRMGAGIAVTFKKQFGKVDKLKQQNPEVGSVIYLTHEVHQYLFYLVTKPLSAKSRPTKANFEKSIIVLGDLCNKFKVTELAVPRLGAGLDRLPWEWVEEILTKILVKENNINVIVYTLPQQ